eukprot:3935150-Rhodomonas_salina.4
MDKLKEVAFPMTCKESALRPGTAAKESSPEKTIRFRSSTSGVAEAEMPPASESTGCAGTVTARCQPWQDAVLRLVSGPGPGTG